MLRRQLIRKSSNPPVWGTALVGARPKIGAPSDTQYVNVPTVAPAVIEGRPDAAQIMGEFTIPTQVRRYYTTVDGTVIDKTDPAVPAGMQVNFPVYLFSQFDRNGGYYKNLNIRPPVGDAKYLMTYVQGVNMPFLAFTGLNTISALLRPGDIVQVYTDSIEAPNVFVWIVISCESVSLASIISNSESMQVGGKIGALWIQDINYYVQIRSQFEQPLFYASFDNVGNYRYDIMNPSQQLTPNVQQEGFLRIPVDKKLDQYFGIALYMTFESDYLQMDFTCSKI